MALTGLHVDPGSEVPVYRQIAEGIREAAERDELRSGSRLPPTRDLARRLGVNRNTVVAAYEALAAEGWIRSHTGRGTFLVAPARSAPPSEAGPRGAETWFTAFSRAADAAVSGGLRAIYGLVVDPEGISFVGSYPAAELIPVEGFARAIARALRERGAAVLEYGPTLGHPPLRDTVAASMRRRGAPATRDDILITNGAQQGLDLVLRTFLERGDAVITEEPTYTGVLSVLTALGARVVGVPLDGEGIRTDLLAIALERHRPRLIYVQPTFQNPTTRVMSPARRRELLELAVRHRCPIVEDDWAADLRLDGDEVETLFALDGGRHVIHVGTFSKSLMPGVRLGWVTAPAPALERVAELKRLQDCGSSPLLQSALDLFLREGGFDEHLARTRPAYRSRRDRMIDALGRHFPEGTRWDRPLGGMFVWVRLPVDIDGEELFGAARREGVLYSRGGLFHIDGADRNTLRLAYSAANEAQIESGIRTLGSLIRERWPAAAEALRSAGEALPIV